MPRPLSKILKRLDASLLVLIVVLGLTLATRYLSPRYLTELAPHPDATEYAQSARNIMERGKFEIIINGQELPSRYSFGFPLLIVPAYLLFGVNYSSAIYSDLAQDLLLVGLVYWMGRSLYGRWAGALAAAIVALSPFDAFNAREYIMSDLPSTVFVFAAILPLIYLRAEPSPPQRGNTLDRLCLFLSGAILSIACWIRLVNIFYLPVLVLFVLFAYRPRAADRQVSIKRLFSAVSTLLAASLLFFLPVLLYNLTTFGALTRTGYNYWVSDLYDDWRNIFSMDYAFGPKAHAASYLRALVGLPERSTYGALIPLYSPIVTLLALIGIGTSGWRQTADSSKGTPADTGQTEARRQLLRRVRFIYLAVGLILITFLIYSLYYFDVDLRFVNLFLPLVAVLASGGTANLFARVRRSVQAKALRVQMAATALSLGVLIVVFLGGWELIEPIQKSTIWLGDVFTPRVVVAPSEVYMQMVHDHTERDAWVVTDAMEPVYFSAFQGYDSERRMLALDKMECCRVKELVIPSLRGSPDLFLQALRQGKAIYFIGTLDEFNALPGISRRFMLEPVLTRLGWENGPPLTLYRIRSSG